jgi:hypothetical protein
MLVDMTPGCVVVRLLFSYIIGGVLLFIVEALLQH